MELGKLINALFHRIVQVGVDLFTDFPFLKVTKKRCESKIFEREVAVSARLPVTWVAVGMFWEWTYDSESPPNKLV